MSQAELDRIFEQKLKELEAQHTAKITSNDNKTYIAFAVRDLITEAGVQETTKLLDLMRVKYQVFITYIAPNASGGTSDDGANAITIEVEGEGPALAAYVQKFINNNYTLPWN